MAQEDKKTFAKNTLTLSTYTTISRITGFLRVIALGSILGLGFISNSFNLANTIPNMIYELILGGVLTSIIIPIFVEYLAKEGEDGLWVVASILFNGILIILGIVAFAGTFFSYYFVRIQTLTVSPQEAALATFFFRFFAIQILFYGIAAIETALLDTHRKFSAPAIAPIFNNIIVISTVVFLYLPLSKTNPTLALTFLATGTTVGVFSMMLVQLPPLIKLGIRYKPIFNFRHPAVIRILKLSLPLFLYVAFNQVQLTVENNLAFKRISEGGVSAIVFTLPFFQLPFGIFAVSIITALFPALSESAALKDMDSFKKDLSLGIRATSIIIIPCAVLMVILAKPILELAWILALYFKKFNFGNISVLSSVLVWLSVGLVTYALFMFLLKVFYALQDTMTPAIVNFFGVLVLIITDLLLINRMGVSAIAVGRTVSFSFMFVIFVFLIRNKIGSLNGKKIALSVGKSLASGLVMAVIVFLSLRFVNIYITPPFINKISAVIIPSCLGVIMFVLTAVLFKNEEFSFITKQLKKRFT